MFDDLSEAEAWLRRALGVEPLDEAARRRRIEQVPSCVGLTLAEALQAIRQGRK